MIFLDRYILPEYYVLQEMGFHRVGLRSDRTCLFLFLFPKYHKDISFRALYSFISPNTISTAKLKDVKKRRSQSFSLLMSEYFPIFAAQGAQPASGSSAAAACTSS
jgi:hypothetical protein